MAVAAAGARCVRATGWAAARGRGTLRIPRGDPFAAEGRGTAMSGPSTRQKDTMAIGSGGIAE
ncbi:MAG: hypothetical protein U0168_32090, partial [Nannocystaceae bacterium]